MGPESIDSGLLQRARDGDRHAQDSVLGLLLPLLRAHAARGLDDRLRSQLDPSDLVQVTLIEAAQAFSQFEGRTLPELRAWILRILRTNHLDQLKLYLAQKRGGGMLRSLAELLGSTATGQLPSPESTPSCQVARRQELDFVAARLAELPEAQQRALLLRLVEGMSVKEVARVMGRSEDAVASLLKRALSHLRHGESVAGERDGAHR